MPAVIAARIHVYRLPPYVAPLGGEDEVKICARGAARGDNDYWLDWPSVGDFIKFFGDGELSVTAKQHKDRLRNAIEAVVRMPDVASHQTSSTGKGGLQLVSRALAIKLFRGWGVPDAVWQPFISHCATDHAMDVDDGPAADEVMGKPLYHIKTITRRQKRPKPATPISSPLMLKSPDAKRLHRRSPIKGRNVTAAPVVTVAKDAGLRLLTDAGKTLEESSSAARRPVYLDDDVVDVAKRVASSTKVARHAASRALVDEPELGRGLVSMVAQAARRPELPVLLRRVVKPFGRFEPPQKLARPTADLSRWTRRRHVCARRETALDAGAVWLALQGLKPIGERGELPDLRGDAQPAFRRHDEERAVDALKDFLTENCLWPTLAVICEQTHAGRQFVAHLALRRLSTRKQGLCEAFDLWRRVGGLSQRAYDDLAARTDRALADIAGASEDTRVVPRRAETRAAATVEPLRFATEMQTEGAYEVFVDARRHACSARRDVRVLLEKEVNGAARAPLYDQLLRGMYPAGRGPDEVVLPLCLSWDAAQLLRDWRRAREHKSTAWLLQCLLKGALADRTRHCLLLGLALDDDGRDALKAHGEASSRALASIWDTVHDLTAREHGGGGGISVKLKRADGVYAPEARAAIYALALDLRAVCEGFNGMGFASPADNPYTATKRDVALRLDRGRGLVRYTPVDFSYEEIKKEHEEGGAAAVLLRFQKRGLPLVRSDPTRVTHGPLHVGGTGTAGVVKAIGHLCIKLGAPVHAAFVNHVASRLGRRFEQNVHETKTTHPVTKTGDFARLGSLEAHALIGFKPPGVQSGGFVTRVIDLLVLSWQRATMARTTREGYRAFKREMQLNYWFAASLLAVCFGKKECRVTARVAANNAGALHGTCQRLSQLLRVEITPCDLSDLPVEDFHRHVTKFYNHGCRGGSVDKHFLDREVAKIEYLLREIDASWHLYTDESRRTAPLALLAHEKKRRDREDADLARLRARREGPFITCPQLGNHWARTSRARPVPAPAPAPAPAQDDADDDAPAEQDEDAAASEDDVGAEEDAEDDATEKFRRTFKKVEVALLAADYRRGDRRVRARPFLLEDAGYAARLEVQKDRIRVFFDKEDTEKTEPGARTFIDVRPGSIYAWSWKSGARTTELTLYLVEKPRFGAFYAGCGRGGAGGVRLAHTDAGEQDQGPLANFVSPFLVLQASRGPPDKLRKAFEEGIVLCSTFLQGRRDKSIPSDAEGWDASHRAELMSELAKDIPLADSAQWDRLRGEVDALVATYRDHRDFVYSSGTEGRPLKRVCDCCKRYVYLSTSDRYTLWSGEVHETCIRPKPGEAEAAVAG